MAMHNERPAPDPRATAMTCQELVELVTDYREGRLSPEERRRFDEHLALCPPCVTYVEQIELTIRALGALTPQVEQAPETQELLTLFRDWKRREGQA